MTVAEMEAELATLDKRTGKAKELIAQIEAAKNGDGGDDPLPGDVRAALTRYGQAVAKFEEAGHTVEGAKAALLTVLAQYA